MDMRHAHAVETVHVVPDQKIDPVKLGQVRAEVKRHFELGGTLEDLEVEPNAPMPGTAFAFVAPTPKLSPRAGHDRSFWRRCSYCQTNQKYKDGKVVLCADGCLRLIGPDCWHEHIDELDWKAAKEDWNAYQRRERFETLKGHLKPAIEAFRDELRTTQESSSEGFIASADALSQSLATRMPELVRHLRDAAKRNGSMLTVERMVLALDALEGAAGYRTSQEKDDRNVRYRPQAQPLHRLASAEALNLPLGSIRHELNEARRFVGNALYLFRTTDWDSLSNSSFKKAADDLERECKASIKAVERLLTALGSIRKFFSPANIAGIVKWANDPDCELGLYGAYEAIPNGIRYIPERGNPVEVALPDGFSIPRILKHEHVAQLLTIS